MKCNTKFGGNNLKHNKNHGELIRQTTIDGYPVSLYLSNITPEKQGNNIVAQLVQSYEERKNSFASSIDYILEERYNSNSK